jgi:hypothetical protein
MSVLISDWTATSPEAAAKMVAEKAIGASFEAKVDRLSRQVSSEKSARPDGVPPAAEEAQK